MTDQDQIDALFVRWKRAVEERDLGAICEMVSEDAEFWTHGHPPLSGRQGLRNALEKYWALFEHRQEFTRHELLISGDLAFIRGHELNQIRMLSGGLETQVVQRAFMVLRRDLAGSGASLGV